MENEVDYEYEEAIEYEEEVNQEVQDEFDFEVGFDESVADEALAAQALAEEEAEIAATAEAYPSLSEDQVRELFEHNNQRIYGKFGEVQREVQQLRALAQQQNVQSQASPMEFNADMFSNMREEFGEDFAQALARDLSRIPLQSQGGGNSQAQIDLIVSQKMEQLKNDFEIRDVARQHPDWQSVANSDDFQNWKTQLPVDIQDKLNNSWDSNFVTASISAYKNDRDLHQRALQQEEAATLQKANQKQRILENAVMPSSSGGSSDNYDDDFEAGFNGD